MFFGLTGTPMPEHRLGKEVVGTGRSGAVDIGKTDDKVVDAF